MKYKLILLALLFSAGTAHAIESRCTLNVYYEIPDGSILADQIPVDKLINKEKPFHASVWKLPPNTRAEDIPKDMINDLSITFMKGYSSAYVTMNLGFSNKERPSEKWEGPMSNIVGTSKRLAGDGMSFQVVCEIIKFD